MDVLPGQPVIVCADDVQPAWPVWLEYPYRKSHLIIRWLPSKLAGCLQTFSLDQREPWAGASAFRYPPSATWSGGQGI
jgi:hypothetical protein